MADKAEDGDLYKAPSIIATSNVRRWFAIGTRVIIVYDCAYRIVVDTKDGVCVIFI